MALNWNSVRAEHVARAYDLLLTGQHRPKAQAKGLLVTYKGRAFPAKHVLRLAYCLANALPLDSKLKFPSGEGTLSAAEGAQVPSGGLGGRSARKLGHVGVASGRQSLSDSRERPGLRSCCRLVFQTDLQRLP